ncbi:SDR family NAD(P)-dependent oxidoreductase [Burkholderia ubonensis]|uniref:SDR family NAD(P)-dependent oxidoreductase n=1 Tax=Burkholderia ubonensis TaxID=101571 RepID=UPI0007567FCE|nr:SDR family NAD(P)-dependent oxidoreductase [Burkholderia ubonensis]KVS98193.1 hypothetical protein WK46_22445 [Burkholderia ubonensis]KVT04622.1 hypothetical protein WK47_17560 [Burkholderia ubonensis]KVT22562.1 hypothetical protein WK50_20315 [Burkholderia ubonensis]
MAHFLDRIEQLSKPQLQALVRALRDEILQLRPDEPADAAPASRLAYETRWQAAPLAAAGPATARAGAPRVLLLTERGAAWPPAGFASCTASELDPGAGWAPDALAAQLSTLSQLSGPFDAIVYAAAAHADAAAEPAAAALAARWGAALALAAAVADRAAPARLWLITRGAQRLPGDAAPADVALAPLAALGRTLSLERPAAWGGCIDVDDSPASLDRAFDEIARDAAGSDDEIAYRAGRRYLPVLERVADASPPRAAFAPAADATYLVTGGAGGIGTVLVDDLLARGAGRVVVFGRRDPAAPEAAAWLAERRRVAGDASRVALVAADPCDPAALGAALDGIRRDGPPLRGIFHAAGSNERIPLARLSHEDIARIVGAKAFGALHLDRLTRADALDFQVYFSSIAGRWGTAQMAPYAMANRFLDALAERREAEGRVTRSLAWGPWAEVGMMVRQRQQGFGALGLRGLAPGAALAALARALGEPGATRQIVDVDWHRYAEQVAAAKHLRPFAALCAAAPAASAEAAAPVSAAVMADDFGTPDATLALLRELVAELTGAALPERGETRPMQELGLNSLLSIELSQKLRQRLGVPCRPTVVFDHPTLHALADALAQAWASANPRPAPGGAAQAGADAARADAGDGAIAIVGMACRLPGADSPDALWARLMHAAPAGDDALDVIDARPAARFDLARYLSDDDAPGKAYSLAGGFLDGLEQFDHARFRLSHREACFMDPQQRLALETTWRAFEDAGIDPAARLDGSAAGALDAAVFFGIGQNEYGPLCRSVADGEDAGLMSTGQSMNVIAGRIAHLFGLDGPAICHDTACSSSLVALDAAVRHLRGGRNRLALVGGVNALVSPDTFVLLGKARALSRQGRCAAFDARADGYVRAEGCVVMVLKRLADARADGDAIHAVIRGSAINHDGRSSGLTAPNGRAQERVMRAALRDAGVDAREVALVEAHGTGTALGDPIEYHALRAVYADERPRATPLVLGALKSFVGHTEAASGLAGLLKLVLSLRARTAPAQLHYATLNPFIDASERIEIPRAARALAGADAGRLLGAVSAFGFNGTNAHVIVERGDDRPSRRLAGEPFARVRCWYTARPLAASSGLAQAFGAAPASAAPASYVTRWTPFAADAAAPAPVRQVLLLRATAAAGQDHDDGRGAPAGDAPRDESTAALTAALTARGIRVVEAACESASGAGVDAVFAAQAAAHGAFDRVVLRVDDGAAWPGDALDADWLERLGGCWAALARLPADAPHVLAIGAAPAPGEPDEPVMQPRWPAVLACADKERAGPSITWLERSPDADDATLAAHLDALLAIREPACRLTRDGLMVPRLARATPAPSAAFRARDGHAYLVSGGLGGVGARVLAWLLEQGARHVVSLNRRAPDAAEAALLDRLGRRHGARIDALATGVADPAALRDALQRTLGATPLAGVFHCAAVLDDRPFAREAWGPARDVLLPKGAGAWHLHRATLGQPLDHFVVFSSLSALLGQPGQAAYALANALAEAVVEHRRALGLPALAIQWGPWAGVGMAARGGDALAAQHRAIGLAARGADDYLRVLADWLAPSASAAPAACVGVFDLDWRRHAATYAPAPLWAGLVADGAGAGAGAGAGTAAAEPPSFAERLAEVPPDRRRHALRARLRELVAACVGCDAASIADTDGFAGIGVDSLHATVLHRQLEREFGASLPATVAFDHPTVAAVADCLARGALGALFAPAGAPAVVPAPASAPPAARAPAAADAPLTDHSAAELARILERELDGLESRGAL